MRKTSLLTSSMKRHGQGGFLLPTVIGLGAVVIALSTTSLVLGSINHRNSIAALRISQAQYAAETGLEQAQYVLWGNVWGGLTPGTRAAYKAKLDLNTYESGLLSASNAGTNVSYPSTGEYTLQTAASYTFRVNRRVNASAGDLNIIFDITSTGKMPDGTSRILTQVFQVKPQVFGGLDYAILANNINCIFCHTSVQNMKAIGNPAAASKPLNRVKVGTLEKLELDDLNGDMKHTADTVIAGSVHVRGDISGGAANGDTNSTFKTLMTEGQDEVTSNTIKNFNVSNCTTLSNCISGNLQDKRGIYKNYPTVQQAGQTWPDGELPDRFPLPIADDGTGTGSVANNRRIDNGEWDSQVNFSGSGLDDQNPVGSITGGVLNSYDPATTALSGGVWPGSGNASSLASTNSSTPKNLILDGTVNPLVINGTMYVNGDVIIRGKIKGKGKIIARGNVYQLGDITYDCTGLNSVKVVGGSECDYTKNSADSDLPQLALIAGGNLMIGDFMTVRGQDFKSLTRADETVELGSRDYYASGNAYQKKIPAESRVSFTYREMGIFNRNELVKYQADNSYKPRFYRYTATSPIVMSAESSGGDAYNNSIYTEYFPELNIARVSTSTASKWDPGANPASNIRNSTSSDIQKLFSGTNPKVADVLTLIRDNAKSVSLPLVASWIGAGNLKKAWINSRECGSCTQGAIRTDSMLYSGNAVFSVARVKPAGGYNIDTNIANNTSNTGGKWDLRGALVSADLGALVTGQNNTTLLKDNWGGAGQDTANQGLNVYYDERMKSFFGQSSGNAVLVRNNWEINSKEIN